MKNQAILLFAFVATLFVACKNDTTGAAATTTEPAADSTAQQAAATTDGSNGTFTINTQNSVIKWIGSKPTGQHSGTIKLQSGELTVSNGLIVGGKAIIDMNSLAVTDLEGQDKADLEGHLKTGDFFDTGKFATGTFEFGSIEPLATPDAAGSTHTVVGSLTLKGIAKPIRIPAKMSIAGGKLIAETPEFGINRTEWDIKYHSGVVGTVKDKLIDDIVKLQVKLEAGM